MASALLVVDVQNDFLPGGALPTIERGVVRAINALLATDNFGVTVASQDWHPEVRMPLPLQHVTQRGQQGASSLLPSLSSHTGSH